MSPPTLLFRSTTTSPRPPPACLFSFFRPPLLNGPIEEHEVQSGHFLFSFFSSATLNRLVNFSFSPPVFLFQRPTSPQQLSARMPGAVLVELDWFHFPFPHRPFPDVWMPRGPGRLFFPFPPHSVFSLKIPLELSGHWFALAQAISSLPGIPA